MILIDDHTFILTGYTVPCNRTVVAWEFCYQIGNATSVTFYPSIWRTIGVTGKNIDYALVQLNTITYDPRGTTLNPYPCQVFNLSDTDQFTAPEGSVVGLYSNVGLQLLHTNIDSSITTYRFTENRSSIENAGVNNEVNYNIAIRAHLGKYSYIWRRFSYVYVAICMYSYVVIQWNVIIVIS